MMIGYKIYHKRSVFLGLILIATGIFLRRLVEITLVSDQRIESPTYLVFIFVFQLLAIASGIFLLHFSCLRSGQDCG